MEQKYVRKITRVGKRSLPIDILSKIVDELKIREKSNLTAKFVT